MSVKVVRWALENGPPDPAARFVLVVLAEHCDNAGTCWPGIATIARESAMTERGVQKITRRLEAEGWLSVVTGGGRHACNRYSIRMVETPNPVQGNGPETPNPVHPFGPETPNGGQGFFGETPNPVHPSKMKTPNLSARNPERGSPEPSRTVIREEKKEDAAQACAATPRGSRLPADWSLPMEWLAWAMAEGLAEPAVRKAAARFADYWRGKAGANARKIDWFATWRNWVRSDLERAKPRQPAERQSVFGMGREWE